MTERRQAMGVAVALLQIFHESNDKQLFTVNLLDEWGPGKPGIHEDVIGLHIRLQRMV